MRSRKKLLGIAAVSILRIRRKGGQEVLRATPFILAQQTYSINEIHPSLRNNLQFA
jgi:hypothetical protein